MITGDLHELSEAMGGSGGLVSAPLASTRPLGCMMGIEVTVLLMGDCMRAVVHTRDTDPDVREYV